MNRRRRRIAKFRAAERKWNHDLWNTPDSGSEQQWQVYRRKLHHGYRRGFRRLYRWATK